MVTSEINKAEKKAYIDSWNMITSEINKAKKKVYIFHEYI